MKKYLKYFFIAVPVMFLIIFGMLEIMSRSAAEIFNKVMQKQEMLIGEITAEKLSATPFGEVSFENLIWKDERGGIILEIPEGSFKVSIFDALTKNFRADSVQELILKNANVSINFDENMNVDFIRHSPDFKKVNADMKKDGGDWEKKVSRVNKSEEELKEIGERRRQMQRSKIEKGWKNFNLEGRKIDLNMKLENCQFEIFYRERHYLLRNVKFEMKVDTANEMLINVRTGKFGGTMIGNGLSIRGNIDFKPEIPQCDLTISLYEVDPSSLGFGLNIHEPMTLLARFTGDISQPVGKGTVTMENLNLPGISFENVEGGIFYKDAMLNFENVTADVYKGKLAAHGDYNIDTRYYNIYGRGEKLKTSDALPGQHLHCEVDLDLEINSKGNAKETVSKGVFTSGKGRYSLLAFDSISGKVENRYKDLHFYDVVIDIAGYKISTDALSIVDKKLKLSPIKITTPSGELRRTYATN